MNWKKITKKSIIIIILLSLMFHLEGCTLVFTGYPLPIAAFNEHVGGAEAISIEMGSLTINVFSTLSDIFNANNHIVEYLLTIIQVLLVFIINCAIWLFIYKLVFENENKKERTNSILIGIIITFIINLIWSILFSYQIGDIISILIFSPLLMLSAFLPFIYVLLEITIFSSIIYYFKIRKDKEKKIFRKKLFYFIIITISIIIAITAWIFYALTQTKLNF